MLQPESDGMRDVRLLALLRHSDTTVLDEVLAHFGVRVEQALKKRFSPALNDTDLEDIMAIGLARLWQTRERYDPSKARLGTWLYVLARSAAVDLLRKRTREAQAVVQHGARPVGNAASEPVSELEVPAEVLKAIGELSERDQAIVAAWLYADGQSDWTRQVCSEWAMTPGNVRVRLTRILQRLRHRLGECGVE